MKCWRCDHTLEDHLTLTGECGYVLERDGECEPCDCAHVLAAVS